MYFFHVEFKFDSLWCWTEFSVKNYFQLNQFLIHWKWINYNRIRCCNQSKNEMQQNLAKCKIGEYFMA